MLIRWEALSTFLVVFRGRHLEATIRRPIMKGVLALTAVVAASAAGVAAQDAEACSTGIHMIVARGSTETPGLGKIGVVAGNASLVVPGSTSAAVDYPASLGDYDDSVEEGRVNIVRMISEYTTRCPESKIALLGYSQGAHVVMDAICGGSQLGFNATVDLPDSFSSSSTIFLILPFLFSFFFSGGFKPPYLLTNFVSEVIAAVAFGDPTHNPEAPWNLGTSSKEGVSSHCLS